MEVGGWYNILFCVYFNFGSLRGKKRVCCVCVCCVLCNIKKEILVDKSYYLLVDEICKNKGEEKIKLKSFYFSWKTFAVSTLGIKQPGDDPS